MYKCEHKIERSRYVEKYDEWTPENGAGDELWRVSEMEVLE